MAVAFLPSALRDQWVSCSNIMKRQVLKEDVGKFGKLIAGEPAYKKTIYGNVLYVDHFGAVAFVDNDDILHKFTRLQVESFEEQEFKPKDK